jgi:pseudouridine-5'-phosphate glycosidase
VRAGRAEGSAGEPAGAAGLAAAGLLRVAEEVAEALASGGPVVALETTLVSHGFSAGRGLLAAVEAERRVRAAGAVPATIGVIDGVIRAGLSGADLERFAEAGLAARKAGARDIAACVVQRALGATTVGGTLAVGRLLGIRFMGTGGIGGVHRGFAESLDISGDLVQIARTPSMVVCSGAKSILDVPATAELLETAGVPVLGWRTGTLPVFYSGEGGPAVGARVETAAEAAEMARTHWSLAASGLLLTRPPDPGLDIEPVLAAAVERTREAGITGQAVTPSVLALVEELTGGQSVAVNRQLIADNAALAAEVAVAYGAAAAV